MSVETTLGERIETAEMPSIESNDIQLSRGTDAVSPIEHLMFGDTIEDSTRTLLDYVTEESPQGEHARQVLLATLPSTFITARGREGKLAIEEKRLPRSILPEQVLKKIHELRTNAYVMTTIFTAGDLDEQGKELPFVGYKSGERRYYPMLALSPADEKGIITPAWRVVMRSSQRTTKEGIIPADIARDDIAVSILRSFQLHGDCRDALEYIPPEEGQTEGIVRLKNASVLEEKAI